jgi:hypothetical protein
MARLDFNVKDRIIVVDNYRIILPPKVTNRIEIVGDTAIGKSVLTYKLEAYENALTVYNERLTDALILNFEQDVTKDILIIDECKILDGFIEKVKQAIIKSKKFVIIISRDFNLAETPILTIQNNIEEKVRNSKFTRRQKLNAEDINQNIQDTTQVIVSEFN